MSADTDLLDGLAQALHDAGVAIWRTDAPYAAGETAIVLGGMPQSPHRAVALALYGPSDDHPDQAYGIRRVQVRVRGLPGSYRDAVDLDDACFHALHALTHQQWGDAHANQVLRISGVPLGQDDAKRWEITSNYQVDLDTPPTALRPH